MSADSPPPAGSTRQDAVAAGDGPETPALPGGHGAPGNGPSAGSAVPGTPPGGYRLTLTRVPAPVTVHAAVPCPAVTSGTPASFGGAGEHAACDAEIGRLRARAGKAEARIAAARDAVTANPDTMTARDVLRILGGGEGTGHG